VCFVFLCKFIAKMFWLQLIKKIHWLRAQKLIEVFLIFFILFQLNQNRMYSPIIVKFLYNISHENSLTGYAIFTYGQTDGQTRGVSSGYSCKIYVMNKPKRSTNL
jgi:hypothetical protein